MRCTSRAIVNADHFNVRQPSMKIFIVFAFFAISCADLNADAPASTDFRAELKNAAFPGGDSAKLRLKAVLQPLFPVGLSEDETRARLYSNFGLADRDMNGSHVEKRPLDAVRDGAAIKIVSWITANLTSFRSIRTLGARNIVSAQFDFDGQRRLVDFSVWASYGPEL